MGLRPNLSTKLTQDNS